LLLVPAARRRKRRFCLARRPLMADRTTIHRHHFSAIRAADEILVMREGRGVRTETA